MPKYKQFAREILQRETFQSIEATDFDISSLLIISVYLFGTCSYLNWN